jgi:hypothetical protein
MYKSSSLLVAAVLALGVPFAAGAEETGPARIGEGVKDAVTAPAEIPKAIGEDAEKTDPVTGTVTGTVKGSVKAAGEVVKGAAEVGVGAVETIVAPVTGQ